MTQTHICSVNMAQWVTVYKSVDISNLVVFIQLNVREKKYIFREEKARGSLSSKLDTLSVVNRISRKQNACCESSENNDLDSSSNPEGLAQSGYESERERTIKRKRSMLIINKTVEATLDGNLNV